MYTLSTNYDQWKTEASPTNDFEEACPIEAAKEEYKHQTKQLEAILPETFGLVWDVNHYDEPILRNDHFGVIVSVEDDWYHFEGNGTFKYLHRDELISLYKQTYDSTYGKGQFEAVLKSLAA